MRRFFLSREKLLQIQEALAKLLKARRKGHSGQAKRDPESRIFKQFWIPAFAGMTAQVTFARTSQVWFFIQNPF
jgi:hypothetical protein